MTSLEDQFNGESEERNIPGVVLVASDVSGTFKYEKAFGWKSPDERIGTDATFIMASCTKLLTSISALQCVERGQIGLDDDVSAVLTELKDIQILTGFKKGTDEPILKKAENKVTIRHLLTHSSGFGYDGVNPLLTRWRNLHEVRGGARDGPLLKTINVPLVFEPGTNFEYGYSLDWAGVLVTRLNNMTLEAYMQKYIWDPLGIKNITFHQELKPEVKKNLVTMTKRGGAAMRGMATPTDEKVQWTDDKLYDDPTENEYGGAGLIGNPSEYLKVLLSICADDGKLLKSATVEEMFKPQLGAEAKKGLQAFMEYLAMSEMFSSQEPNAKLDYGLGGLLILSDKTTGVKSGTLSWSGLPNLLWTIDRKSKLCLLYAGNVVPFGDHKSQKMQRLFEREMYTRASKI